jgi:CheY-like chemotaxis protein
VSAAVLIVEDSALVVSALRLLLEDRGFRVSAAGSVADALETARREPPDAMLLDLSLPDGDGLVVLERLTSEGRAPSVTAAMTGHDDPRTRQRCLTAGCREVLVKPMRALELPGQIRRWLDDASRDRATADS